MHLSHHSIHFLFLVFSNVTSSHHIKMVLQAWAAFSPHLNQFFPCSSLFRIAGHQIWWIWAGRGKTVIRNFSKNSCIMASVCDQALSWCILMQYPAISDHFHWRCSCKFLTTLMYWSSSNAVMLLFILLVEAVTHLQLGIHLRQRQAEARHGSLFLAGVDGAPSQATCFRGCCDPSHRVLVD